ncbi:MAG: ABC transporter permease [Desulfobacula sp.]|jgi:ABC-type dipeptide/oligopeptide/nickel transport system permease subunit|nr:ABC transporter permease [Desulfobacula sp.]
MNTTPSKVIPGQMSLTPRWSETLSMAFKAVVKVKGGLLGTVFISIMLLCAFCAQWISPYDPDAQDIVHRFAGPGLTHLLGTDYLGRDILSRIIYGCRIAVLVAFGAVSLSSIIGVFLGVIAGYNEGKKIDYFRIWLFDIVRSFPQIILALAIVAVLGPSLVNVVMALAFTAFPFYGRIARAQTLSVKEADYVKAAEAMGQKPLTIILRHITPNIMAPVIVCLGMDMATMIIWESGLSFLGLGVRPPTASWGIMLRNGYKYIQVSPWMILWPALAIAFAMIAFSLFSEGLRVALDPKERER